MHESNELTPVLWNNSHNITTSVTKGVADYTQIRSCILKFSQTAAYLHAESLLVGQDAYRQENMNYLWDKTPHNFSKNAKHTVAYHKSFSSYYVHVNIDATLKFRRFFNGDCSTLLYEVENVLFISSMMQY